MPQYLMSIRTSRGPTSRRSIVSGASGAVGDGAPKAWAVRVRGGAVCVVSLVMATTKAGIAQT